MLSLTLVQLTKTHWTQIVQANNASGQPRLMGLMPNKLDTNNDRLGSNQSLIDLVNELLRRTMGKGSTSSEAIILGCTDSVGLVTSQGHLCEHAAEAIAEVAFAFEVRVDGGNNTGRKEDAQPNRRVLKTARHSCVPPPLPTAPPSQRSAHQLVRFGSPIVAVGPQ